RVAGGHPAEGLRDRHHQWSALVQQQRPRSRGLRLLVERLTQLALRLRPDPGNLAEPSLTRRLPQLVECADAEHAPDVHQPADRDAEQAADADELRRDLALEPAQLRDAAGLDQLLQPALDAGPDPAELTRPALPHQFGYRRRRRADQVRGATIGPRRVRLRPRELEQRGELV